MRIYIINKGKTKSVGEERTGNFLIPLNLWKRKKLLQKKMINQQKSNRINDER